MEDRNQMEILEELIDNTELNKTSIIDDYWDLFLEVSKGIKDNCFRQGYAFMKQIFHEDLSRSFTIYKELYHDSIYPEFQKFGEQVISRESNWRYEIKELSDELFGGISVINNTNDLIYGIDVQLSCAALMGKVEYKFKGIYAYGESVDKILCDKIISTLSSQRFKRIKDFYDIYIIESNLVYDKENVQRLIVEKVDMEELKSLYSRIPFSMSVMERASLAWNKAELINGFTREKIEKQDFGKVISAVYNVYDRVFYDI